MSQQNSSDVLRHVVLFGFKPETSETEITAIENAFRALPEQIDLIKGFEWGTDVSVENKAAGYTHCFFLTFASEADRDAYLPHPAHAAFGTLVRQHLAQVLVVDYWAKS
ncbi:MAG: Dabb family protein [Chloroflexota bacterium]